MNAVKIVGPRRVAMIDVEPPVPRQAEVLVRVLSASLCATDRRMAALGTHAPRIPGHEIAGVLEDGTPVGVHPNIGCGRCASCAAGFENRCPDHVDIGIHRDGGLAQIVAVPERHVVPLDGVPIDRASLAEPLATVLHAAGLLAPTVGAEALVVGAGTLGILGMWALRSLGARVTVMQRSEPRRALASRLGADAVIGPDDDPPAAMDVALVTAPGPEPLRWTLDRVKVGGTVHAFAGTPGGAPIDANVVHYRHLRLVGSTGSTLGDYRSALELVRSGGLPLERLPTTVLPLEDVPAALLDADPHALRYVTQPWGTTAIGRSIP